MAPMRFEGRQIPQARRATCQCDQAAQKCQPAGTVIGGNHVHTEDLPLPACIDSHSDNDRDVDDAAAFSDLLCHRVEPQVGLETAVEGPVGELGDGFVEFGGHRVLLSVGLVGLPRG
jgi:hypothetical protein